VPSSFRTRIVDPAETGGTTPPRLLIRAVPRLLTVAIATSCPLTRNRTLLPADAFRAMADREIPIVVLELRRP
jgi:hypothetical protein